MARLLLLSALACLLVAGPRLVAGQTAPPPECVDNFNVYLSSTCPDVATTTVAGIDNCPGACESALKAIAESPECMTYVRIQVGSLEDFEQFQKYVEICNGASSSATAVRVIMTVCAAVGAAALIWA